MKTTMHDKLLRLLRRKWTSPLDALREAGCLSLAQRVSEWRRAGMAIGDKWLALPDGRRVKQYKVLGGAKAE